MIENVRLAFQGIWSHKMRSFLTMLGIIIGIAAIISIVSTIKGTQEQIKQNLIGSGNNTVTVTLSQGDSDYETEWNGLPDNFVPVTDEEMSEIEDLPEVESAAKYVQRSYADSIFYHSTSLDGAKVLGIDQNYLSVCGYAIKTGRSFISHDYEKYNKVVLMDETAADSLFSGENAIGKTIEIKGEPYTVIGIAVRTGQIEPVINSISDYMTYHQDSAGVVFLPLASWPISYYYDEPENVVIRATETETMSAAGKKTQDILNNGAISASAAGGISAGPVSSDTAAVEATSETAGGSTSSDSSAIKYKASDVLETAKNLQALAASTNSQLLWIASISLLVGGIGVMNIMLVSVTERTREIGLKKALGARKRKIMQQFLTEAAVLTSIGGALGVVAGLILSRVISKISQTPTAISIPAIILSVVFSMVIGIVFGLLPSYKAANLNPIDALRYE